MWRGKLYHHYVFVSVHLTCLLASMVLPVNRDVLKSAIRDEARSNAGFLYITSDESIKSIKQSYADSDETGLSSINAGSVSRDQIQSQLESMTTGSDVEMIRDGTVYFFNPFRLPGDESNALFETLTNVFEEKRYFTRRDLVEHLRKADIHIAEDDIGDFIHELKSRDLLTKLVGQTAYYRPGEELRENTELKSRSEIIENEADSDGCITHTDLEKVLDIDRITKEIKQDLTEDDVLYELEDKYLVNSETSKDAFVEHFVENKLGRPVRESFKSSDWVKTETEFEQDLENQIKANSNVLSVVNEEDLFYDLKSEVESELDLESEKVRISRGQQTIFKESDKFEDLVQEEATAIEKQVEEEVDNSDPPSMGTALEGIEIPRYGSDSITNEYVREKVLGQAREQIDENDEINIWANIEK